MSGRVLVEFQSSPGSREPGVVVSPSRIAVSRPFQSSPGSREPGVVDTLDIAADLIGFNPRPAHVSRASGDKDAMRYAWYVSILARLT